MTHRSLVSRAVLRPLYLGAAVSFGVLGITGAAGCSSSDSTPPETAAGDENQTPFAEQMLADMDIGSDELIGDQADDEDQLLAETWPASTVSEDIGPEDDLEDQTDADVADDLPEVLPDPDADVSEDAPEIAASAKNPDWWSKKFACPHNPLHASCECRGTMYNCQFPSPQPGRNRYLPPKAIHELHATPHSEGAKRKAIIEKLGRWEIAGGQPLYDGAGHLRGTFTSTCYDEALQPIHGTPATATSAARPAPTCVKINFGQLKKMQVDGSTEKKSYVYAFAVMVGAHGAGGWVLAEAIQSSAFKRYNTPVRSTSHFATTDYVVRSAPDYQCDPATYSSDKCLPAWAQLKIRPHSSPAVSEKGRDYMLRDGNTLNLAYQTPLVGGAATDTFMIGHDNVAFKRAKSIDSDHRTILRVPLYHPNGTKSVGKMYMVYGEMEGRFGWVALAAIKKGKVAAAAPAGGGGGGGGSAGGGGGGPTGTETCTGKADGYYCGVTVGQMAYECVGQAESGSLFCRTGAGRCHVGPDGKAVVNSGTLICDGE